MDTPDPARYRAGLLFGLAAHACWGLMPIYVSRIPQVRPLEFLCHRILWSAVLLAALLTLAGKWNDLRRSLRHRRSALLLLASTVLIAVNWFVFLYGVSSGQALQNSLGYYTNPLFNVLLGVLVLGERLRPGKWAGLALAAGGIAYLMIALGQVPWIALTVASSFALYGLARKLTPVDGLVGLSFETLVLAPAAFALVGGWVAAGEAAFLAQGPFVDAMILLSGPVTVVPLLCFVLAARRLPLTVLGFLQYVGPTMQLLIAVFVLGEEFGPAQWVGFGLIWAALAVVTLDTLLAPAQPAAERNSAEQRVQVARS